MNVRLGAGAGCAVPHRRAAVERAEAAASAARSASVRSRSSAFGRNEAHRSARLGPFPQPDVGGGAQALHEAPMRAIDWSTAGAHGPDVRG
jgi:hypothetical protein